MKISKKILSMVLCGFILFGGSQANLIKADAASNSSNNGQWVVNDQGFWEQGIRLKLKAKWNPLCYKDWWEIKLVYQNGRLILTGPTNIPSNLTFDDTFVFGYMDNKTRCCQNLGRLKPSFTGSAEKSLIELMNSFNAANIRYADYVYMNGEGWDGTLRFSAKNRVIKQRSTNQYSNGYRNVNRWNTGFRVLNNCLEEATFGHGVYN